MRIHHFWMLLFCGGAVSSIGCAQPTQTVEEVMLSTSHTWQFGTRWRGDYWGPADDAWMLGYVRADASTGHMSYIAFVETVGSAAPQYQRGERFCLQEYEATFSEIAGVAPEVRVQETDHFLFDDCSNEPPADMTWLVESSTPGHLTKDTVLTSWRLKVSLSEPAPSKAWWEGPAPDDPYTDKSYPCAAEDQIPGTKILDPDHADWGGWCQSTTPDFHP